jgi:hypothetical protein
MVLLLTNWEGEGMQKTSRVLAFSFGLFSMATLVVPTTLAQVAQTSEPTSQQTMKAETVTISGKVSAVSATSVTVVDDKKVEQVIAIDTNTKITRAGKEATAADLKADDVVTVVANKGEGNALTAVSIKVA